MEQKIINVEPLPAKEITRIGVVSDTHIPTRGRALPRALFSHLQGVDLILHAGDAVDESVLEQLSLLAPVEAVAGNMDPDRLWRRLGRRKLVHLGSIRIGLVHGDAGKGVTTPQKAWNTFAAKLPDAIIFGHSHMPLQKKIQGVLLLNPGSPVDPRRSPQPSCALLTLEKGKIRSRIIYL